MQKKKLPLGLALVALILCLTATPLLAAHPESASFVPADSGAYGSFTNGKVLVEKAAGTKAWENIKALPSYNFLKMLFETQRVDEESPIGQFYRNPDAVAALDLFLDGMSQDAFYAFDGKSADTFGLLMELNVIQGYGPLFAMGIPNLDEKALTSYSFRMIGQTLAQNVENLEVPNALMGMKLTDKKRANVLLQKLETLIEVAPGWKPGMKLGELLSKKKIHGNEFLVLTLTGEMLPWEEANIEELIREWEIEKGDFDELIKHAKKMKLVIAIGFYKDYLVFSVGNSTDYLASLGKGKGVDTLPEFAELAKKADGVRVGTTYASKELNAMNDPSKTLNSLRRVFLNVLPLYDLSDEVKKKIEDDVNQFCKDAEGTIYVPGAYAEVCSQNSKGIESYALNWGQVPFLDKSKPLSGLYHVGGNPLMSLTLSTTYDVAKHKKLVAWGKTLFGYIDTLVKKKASKNDLEEYNDAMDIIKPALKKFNDIMVDMILPAMDGDQETMLVDTGLTSKQFFAEMPPADNEMPMFEPAWVGVVKDPDLFAKGILAAWETLDKTVNAIAKANNEDPITFPQFKKSEDAAGLLYVAPLAREVVNEIGLDKQIIPTLLVTKNASDKNVAIFAASVGHAKRLAKKVKPELGAALPDPDAKSGMVVSFSFPKLIDFAKAWVSYGFAQAKKMAPPEQQFALVPIEFQVYSGLNAARFLGDFSLRYYQEGDVEVSHAVLELKD